MNFNNSTFDDFNNQNNNLNNVPQPDNTPEPLVPEPEQNTQPSPANDAVDIEKTKQRIDEIKQMYFASGSDGNLGEAAKQGTGEAITQTSFRYQENDTYMLYKKVDNAASWLSVFAEDFQTLQAANQYDQIFNMNNLDELKRIGLYSEKNEQAFQHIAGLVPYSNDDLQHIADYGSIQLSVSFSDVEKNEIKSFLKGESSSSFKSLSDMFAIKGIDPESVKSEDATRAFLQTIGINKETIDTIDAKKGSTYIRTFDDSGRATALEALAERHGNAGMFDMTNTSEKGQMVQIYREKRYAELSKRYNLPGFKGTQKDYLEIMETHQTKSRKKQDLSNGKYTFTQNKKDGLPPKGGEGWEIETFHSFHGTHLEEDTYKALMTARDEIGGENNRSLAFLSRKNSRIRSIPGVFMDDTMKTGFGIVSTMTDYTRRLTSFAYSSNLKHQIKHTEFLKKNYSAQGELLDTSLKGMFKNKTLLTGKNIDADAIQDAEKLAVKAKDYLGARENLRLAKRGRSREELHAAREKLKVEKRAYRGTRREIKESKFSESKRQKLQAKRRQKLDRRERFNNSKVGQYKQRLFGSIKEKIKRRQERFIALRQKIYESKLSKSLSNLVEKSQKLKMKIFGFLGGAMVLILKWLFTICLWGCVIGLIVSFFVGLFDDKTNYAEVAQIDMYDLEDSFNYMAKKQVYDEFQDELKLKKKELLSLKYTSPNKDEYEDNTGDHYVTIAEPAVVGYMRGEPYTLSSGQTDYRWVESTNPGSIVPYFAIAKYRYNEELDKDWYRTYLAYMTYLWVNSHYYLKNSSTQIRNVTHTGNLDNEGCDNKIYHKGVSQLYDVPLSTLMYYFDRGLYAKPAINYTYYTDKDKKNTATERCDKCTYTYEVDYNHSICNHVHDPWVSAEEPGCYETITAQSYQLICTKEPHIHGVDICDMQCIHLGEEGHVCDENCEKRCVIEEHTHVFGDPNHPSDTNCYGFVPEAQQGALKCGHVHNEDVSYLCNYGLAVTDSCYGSRVSCQCDGHCGGHIEPQITLYYVDDIESIVKSANCVTDLFKPTRRIPYYLSHQPKMFMDDILDKGKYTLKEIWQKITKRDKAEDKTIYDEWKEHWKKVFSDINDSNNPMWPKFENDGEKLSEAEAMHEYGDGKFTKAQIEEMRSLYGDSSSVGGDNYLTGIELWEDFDVFFPKPLSGNTSELIREYTEKIKNKYGLSGTQNLVITLNALLEVGKWTCLNNDASYNVENHTAGSTGMILYILGKSGYNVSNIHSTDDLTNWLGLSSKKAKQNGRVVELNKKIGLDILASTYKSMKPGTIVFQDRSGLDKRQYGEEHIAIFLGAYQSDKDDNDYIYTFAEASASTGQFTIVQYGVSALDRYFNKAWYIDEE